MVVAVLGIGLSMGYIVWWLIALGRGQTPGKQIVGICVIKDNGEPSGWGYTFLREFVIKLLLVGFIAQTSHSALPGWWTTCGRCGTGRRRCRRFTTSCWALSLCGIASERVI